MSEKVGEAYLDLVINEDSVNKSLKETKNKIVSELKGTEVDLKLKPDPDAFRISDNLKLKVQQVNKEEERRLSVILGENDALDKQIAKMVQITNQQKAAAGGFFRNLASGGLQGNQRQIMNQFTYSMQDFLTVLTMPGMGLGGALRGAANNWSMMFMQMSPVNAMLASMAVSTLPALFDWMGKTTDQTQKHAQANEYLADSLRRLQQGMQHASRMRQAGDISALGTPEQVDAEMMKTAKDKNEALEKQRDLEGAIAAKRREGELGNVTRVGINALREMGFEEFTRAGELSEGFMTGETGAATDASRAELFQQRTRAIAGKIGLNPDEYTATTQGDEVIFTRIAASERLMEVTKQIKELETQLREEKDKSEEAEKRLLSLREKRVEILNREKELMKGPMDQEHARKMASAESKRAESLREISEMTDLSSDNRVALVRGVEDDFTAEKNKINESNSRRIQTDADRQFNELETGNRRFQSQREQINRFQFGLEMGAVDDRRVFANRRKQAEFQLEENLRRNEEMTREGSDERKRGAGLAVDKYKSEIRTITQDEERAKSRVRIDALRYADPRKWALEEAEFRRKERLRQLDLTGTTGSERASMEAMINRASAQEKVELLRQAERRNPAEFMGGEAMWKKIQLGMLQQPDSPAVKAAIKTADNTGKLVDMVANGGKALIGGPATFGP